MLNEFSLIERYFKHRPTGAWASQGVGDDCALLTIGSSRLAVTMDQMAIGTHFLPEADPYNVGYKALAVNLSDLAAAGAVPRAFFLGLGLSELDEAWVRAFSEGLMALAREAQCDLLGGDTTKTPRVNGVAAPTTIAITALGEVPLEGGLTRSGARPGEDIWVTGTLGDAYLSLMLRWGRLLPNAALTPEGRAYLDSRMDRPTPRYLLGAALQGIASAAADISDGFAQDLGHILTASGVSAQVQWEEIPKSKPLLTFAFHDQERAVLSGGDDYELVFTAPVQYREQIVVLSHQFRLRISLIGSVIEPRGDAKLIVRNSQGLNVPIQAGFDHFGNSSDIE